MKRTLDWNLYLETAAKTVAEGIVMLKNDNNALPLDKSEEVAVFGRIQLNYYKSGTGSGGMVNVSKVVGITEGLCNAGVNVNKQLLDVYEKWTAANPFDYGIGWGQEPWSQKEMELTDELCEEIARTSRTAIVIIGRTAGEEMDNKLEKGAFLLSDAEEDMLAKTRKAFERVVVLLNVGGLIDMSFVDKYNPDSVMYVWQGGMVGGTGTAMTLTGEVSPCGKLSDTIAYSVSDYPSAEYFGDNDRDFYAEDIYVGYRYFETFAKDRVRYPFGFGLSYTDFEIRTEKIVRNKDDITIDVVVKNVGKYVGKEVVQLYCKAPQGKLGKAERVLCAYEKTSALKCGEEQKLTLSCKLSSLASYDDSGVTGHRYCNILEGGNYEFYVGNSVRNTISAGIVSVDETVTEKLEQALAPVEAFERMKNDNGKVIFEAVPLSEISEESKREENLPKEIAFTDDKGIKLCDVKNGKNTMDEFIAQLSDYDLSCIIRGEGMGSPKVTAGTASAFGGVTDKLKQLGIPCGCCSDGPSGMRLDCGTKAFSLPNGTMIACTFNKQLVTELFNCMGLEMTANEVDCLLGPGMNIHRYPLNGRNFEYFSEDPFLTGTMAAAELDGLHSAGVTGTIKHFCANNQEQNRHFLDSIVSERALREIYLKGFEIAVKQGKASTIMTTYGSVNGVWTAGRYDLTTTILRKEWGFDGVAMTDWWANINRRGNAPDRNDFAAMAMAQNDVYMVCADSSDHEDTTMAELENGLLKRSELQRNAANICRFIMTTHAMDRMMGIDNSAELVNVPVESGYGDDGDVTTYTLDGELDIDLSVAPTTKGTNYAFALVVEKPGFYDVEITASSELSELAQTSMTLFCLGTSYGTFTWNGTGGKPVTMHREIPYMSHFIACRMFFAQSGLKMHSIKFKYNREIERP